MIAAKRPDVVVGSSWGGAVAALCLARGIYNGGWVGGAGNPFFLVYELVMVPPTK